MKPFIHDEKLEQYLIIPIFGLVFGLLTIVFVFWNRLIRERLPRDLLNETFSPISYYLLCFTTIILFISCIVSCILAYREYYGIKKQNKYITKFLAYISEIVVVRFIQYYILGAAEFLVTYIYVFCSAMKYSFIPYYLFVFWSHILPLFNSPDYEDFLWRHRVTLVIFVYLPKLFCFSILLYEVAIAHYIESFYHYAILLIIPYIFNKLQLVSFVGSFLEMRMMEEDQEILIDKNFPGYIDTLQELKIPLGCYSKNPKYQYPGNLYSFKIQKHFICLHTFRSMATFKNLKSKDICVYLNTVLSVMMFSAFLFWLLVRIM